MNYEKKYKEALERAKKFIEANPLVQNLNTWIKETFPELKEPEDEKVRKALIEMVHDTPNIECEQNYNVRKEDCLAWLEKQGEQKPAWSEEDEKEYKYVLKFVDNILNNCGNKKDYEHCKRCYDWLKSLKPQNTWKPSDEQMEALENAIRYGEEEIIGILSLLYNDLKKLREDKL